MSAKQKEKFKKKIDLITYLGSFQNIVRQSGPAATASYGLIFSILIFTYIGWNIDHHYDSSNFAQDPIYAQIREIAERSHDQASVQMHTGSNPAHAGRPRPRSTNTSIAVSTMIEVVIIFVIVIAMQTC